MMANTAEENLVKIVTTHSIISALTIPALVLYLTYFDNINNVGYYSTIYVSIFIVIVELMKVNLSMMLNNTNTNGREKLRKTYMKMKIKELLKCFLLTITSVVVYYIIAVLFGAELFDKCEETLMLSILVTSLTVIPSCFNLSAEQTIGFMIGKYTSNDLISDMILQSIQLTCFGTWLGAIAIPLDWQRPWQKWPITCYFGALAGYFASSIITLIKLLRNIIEVYTGKSLRINKVYSLKNKI